MLQRVVLRTIVLSAVVCLTLGSAPSTRTDRLARRIGSMKLVFSGVTATVDPLEPVAPKNVPDGVRIVVTAGGNPLSAADAEDFLGGPFEIEGELSGSGLPGAKTLRSETSSLLLPIPALNVSGDYTLSNIRLVVDSKPVLDVTPQQVPLRVIEQVLITSVKTRPLTLAELKERGVVFDGYDVVGFEFTLAMTPEAKPVNISFPVAFDREGLAVPHPLKPPARPARTGVGIDLPSFPTIVPLMLEAGDGVELPEIELPGGERVEIRIPSVLVIPGDVGFLKQFFSAQLFVANGTPGGSGLVVRDVSATIQLPPGPDSVPRTADDPLALPELTTGIQEETLPVTGAGPDGEPGTTDDNAALAPGEQGQAEFLVRGESEGFHTLDFDIDATLDGLVTGPIQVKGRASGGVLVRNPFLDVTFTVPSVVRAQEPFKLYVNVRNIGDGLASRVDVSFNELALSGLKIADGAEATKRIDETLQKGDSATVVFDFEALRTGKLVATYLKFDSDAAADGTVNFTLGVGERNVPLSPDTLVLPAAVDALPTDLVNAAMRVLGQAWSVANAPAGTLPPDVIRIRKNVVIEKALAFAEGGLRIELGEPPASAVRGLLFDFFGGALVDAGFDQLLRTTNAGSALTSALAVELTPAIADAGGLLPYERETARVAASGDDFITFAVDGAAVDAPGATLFEQAEGALGIVTEPTASPYELALTPAAAGTTSVALTLPRGDGTFVRGTASFDFDLGARGRLVADLFRPESLTIEIDTDGDGLFETAVPLALETIAPEGPSLVSATVIGPELLDGASSFGFHAAALFDRAVDEATASDVARYTLPENAVRGAVPQLSGRLVFLTLERPEGPYVPTTLDVEGIRDSRGVVGPPGSALMQSRLAEEGAILSGQVFEANGTPVSSGSVGYANYRGASDCSTGLEVLFAEVPLDANGRYELRYVRRDPCGGSFRILFTDPDTGELRSASGFVRAGGERIVLDLALFGRGAVSGVVTENGQPAPGASVVVTSGTDPQSGAAATTDGDGRYTVYDVVVGPVSVKAARGIAVGASSGRIARGGTTAAVDVALDPGRARITGTVSKLEGGVTSLLPEAQVVYSVESPGSGRFIAVAVTRTDVQGSYTLEDLPHGNFQLEAILDSNARFAIEATASPGDDLVQNIIIPIASEAELGTLSGVVRLPDGVGVEGAEVRVGTRAVLTGVDGTFSLPGVPVKPGQTQLVLAVGPRGLRSGRANVVVSSSGQRVDGVIITLSGLGSATFTVQDAAGEPVPNQLVGLIGACANLCGCASGLTNGLGEVTFDDLAPGTHFAKAVLVGANFVDVALGSARVDGDGATSHGVVQFEGVGTLTGTVLLPGGVDPAVGANVTLTSKVFNRDACELRSGPSHSGRTDADGRFAFTGVNFGRVSVTASHPFANKTVGDTAILTWDTPVDFTIELVDTTAGVLSGTVFLPDGVTPAGAGVELTAIGPLPEVTVRTDDAGRYEFAAIFPQGLYTLTVSDPVTGFVTREKLFLRVGEDTAHDFRLKGRGTVRVHVADAAGAPVPNAFVKLTESEFPGGVFEAVLEPRDDGIVTFTNVFEGPFSVEAQDIFGRDGGRVPSVLPGPDATIELEVRLNAVGVVEGHFRLPDATPIPFATVKLLSGGRVMGQATTAGSGDVGAFRFDYVPVGPVRLEAQDPLTARPGFATGELPGQDQTLSLDIQAQGLGRVEGTVTTNAIGQDAAHVDLVSGTFRACAVADATGFYFLEGVPEGVVAVTASLGNGFLSGTSSDVLLGDGSTLRLDVALRDSVTLTGTVTRAGTADPAPPSLVTVRVGGVGGGTQSTTSDVVDGTFRFERVPAGLTTIDVEVLGGIDKARRVVDLSPGQPADVPIRLNGVGSLRVRALDSSGLPTAGRLVIRGTGSFPYTFVIELSAGGEVLLPEVLAGPVTTTLDTGNLFGTASDTVRPGEELDLPVQVEDSGTVRGVAQLGGAPVVGAEVRVKLSANRGTVSTRTDVDGTFEVQGVPLGTFDLRITDPFTGGVGATTGLELVTNGEVLSGLVIELDASPIMVTGVEPPDGSLDVPVDQVVLVHFSDPVASFANAVFVRDGTLTIATTKNLSPDALTLTLEGTWPDSRELSVEVTTELTDTLGRRALSAFSSRFRTVDLSPPEVVDTTPANGAIQVGVDTSVTVVFNEPLGAATDIGSLITLNGPAGEVAGTAELVSPSTVRFTPSAPLVDNASYAVSVNGAVDVLGNRQTAAFTSSFATPDTTPPSLLLTTPAPGGWTTQATPNINFIVDDNLSGMDPGTIALTLDAVAVVPSFVGASSFSFVPAADLAQGMHEVVATVADRGGNVGSFSASFRVDSILPAPAQLEGLAEGQTVQGQVALSAVSSDDGSGVARIDVRRDGGSLILSLFPPTFDAVLSTNPLSEGDHVLFARAVDVAGNTGPDGTPVSFVVDNRVLSINITAPVARTPPLRFRDEVAVRATPSEAVERLEFSVGSVSLSDDTAPYEVTLPLDAAPEGTVSILVTGFGVSSGVATAVREIVVDRTPPPPPDAAVIRAEPPQNGVSLVFGRAGAVEPDALVEAVNTTGGATASVTAGSDGAFAMSLSAAVDDVLSLTATDALGNVSAPTTIVVRRTPSLPPSEGATSLRFEGVLVDRVGPGEAELAPDGELDAVFTVSLSIGEGVTRELEFIDLERLEGPAANGLRSTRASVGAILGVAADAGAPLLNNPDGQASFPITTGATLTLFAADGGFVQEGETYSVTAAFTDGSRFVGRFTLTPSSDAAQVSHSASLSATPSTLVTDGLTPAIATLRLTDIRDIEGVLVPDGAKVALAVADMASTDPRGNPFRSAGGTLLDGAPAANRAEFRVFTISGGEVVATYSSEPVVPTPVSGAQVLVQVLASDADDNVLGTRAIGTLALQVRQVSDEAIVSVTPAQLYADKADRRVTVSVEVRDTAGNPVPDGTKVLLSAGFCGGRINGICVSSAGGAIVGGEASPSGSNYRAFTVTGGRVAAEYASSGLFAGVGDVRTATVQVVPADDNGVRTSSEALGVAPIALVGAAGAEIDLSPSSVPVVFPTRPVSIRLSHVHDARGNLVPDDAKLLVSASFCATRLNAVCVASAGGTILDGEPSPTNVGLKAFSLSLGEVVATYAADNVSIAAGGVKTAGIQIAMGDPAGARLDNEAVAVANLSLVATTNAVGSAEPPSLLADGALHVSTVLFDPVLDAFGNVVPDGSKVVASAAFCASRVQGVCVTSAGGQILNGESSPSGSSYKVLTVAYGAVTAQYANQNVIAAPGQLRRANVQLLAGASDGRFLHHGTIGVVPVDLAGLTSAQSLASPASVVADGSDRRATLTFSLFRDAAGQPVPDGTRVALSASVCAGRVNGICVSSAGGQVVGGQTLTTLASHYHVFTIVNDQVVAEYSASGKSVTSGSQTAVVQVLFVRSTGTLVSNEVVATAPIQLLSPPSTVVAVNPMDLLADGSERLSQLTVSQLSEPGGAPIPDGAKVGLSATDCATTDFDGACLTSAGGEIRGAGTSPGDGDPAPNEPDFRVFTVAGGQVRAAYAATGPTGIAAGVGETLEARIAVVTADATGNVSAANLLGTGTVRLHGTSSATASGPASLALGETGDVTFSGIKDAVGNTVPDGTTVLVRVSDAGGTLTGGTVYTVTGGAVTVTYSTAGASSGITRIEIFPARNDATPIFTDGSETPLMGGVHEVTITP